MTDANKLKTKYIFLQSFYWLLFCPGIAYMNTFSNFQRSNAGCNRPYFGSSRNRLGVGSACAGKAGRPKRTFFMESAALLYGFFVCTVQYFDVPG